MRSSVKLLFSSSIIAAIAAACGARDALPEGQSSPAQGGGGAGSSSSSSGSSSSSTSSSSSSSSGSSSSSSSSSGVISDFCPVLVPVDPIIELPFEPSLVQDHDGLLLPFGGDRVLALARREPSSTLDTPSEIVAAMLSPWTSWPPGIDPPLTITSSAHTPFVAMQEGQNRLSLSVTGFQTSPSCSVDSVFGFLVTSPPGQSVLPFSSFGPCQDAPLAVATTQNNELHLAVHQTMMGNGIAVVPTVLDQNGVVVSTPPPSCASTPHVADVSRRQTRFLLAHSAAPGGGACDAQNIPGPANRVVLRRIDAQGEQVSEVYSGADDIVYLRLLPTQGGSWLVVHESGASAEIQPAATARKVMQGGMTGPAFTVTSDGTSLVAAGALGDGLISAFIDTLDPSAPTVILHVYDPDGVASGATSFPTNAAWLVPDRMSVVGSPDGQSFLIAWTGVSSFDSPSRIFVRRFDCASQ